MFNEDHLYTKMIYARLPGGNVSCINNEKWSNPWQFVNNTVNKFYYYTTHKFRSNYNKFILNMIQPLTNAIYLI